jgi:hypothetical protein
MRVNLASGSGRRDVTDWEMSARSFHADSMAYEGAEILEMDKKLSDSRTIQCDTNTNNISFNEGLSLRVVSGKDRERWDTRPRDAMP